MTDLVTEKPIFKEDIKFEFDIHDLEQTEGYAKLTPRQQQMIRVSLLVTERDDRRGNPESRKHIADHNCHGSIVGLERENFFNAEAEGLPEGFFNAKYSEINVPTGKEIAENLKGRIIEVGFPCVVHVSDNPKALTPGYVIGSHEKARPAHSFLVLGEDRRGNTLIWDKEGFSRPYRIMTLRQVCEDNWDHTIWGVRSLRKE